MEGNGFGSLFGSMPLANGVAADLAETAFGALSELVLVLVVAQPTNPNNSASTAKGLQRRTRVVEGIWVIGYSENEPRTSANDEVEVKA